MKNSKTRQLTLTAMFAALAALLMYVEFPVPFMPPFLKMDLSGVPTLIAAFMLGPVSGVAVTLIKDLVHVLSTQTGGVGELADFLIMSSFVLTASAIYKRNKSKKTALQGCLAGMVVITLVGMLANRYLLIPFFAQIMPIDAIVGACAAVNPLIGSINTYVIFGAAPFNLLKGAIICLFTVLLYKRISNIFHKELTRPEPAKKQAGPSAL